MKKNAGKKLTCNRALVITHFGNALVPVPREDANLCFSSQTTQLTQFSAVSGQFKNRTVAKVRVYRSFFRLRICLFFFVFALLLRGECAWREWQREPVTR